MHNSKTILLIGDMPGWAFDHIITFVRKYIKGFDFYFDFTTYNPRLNSNTISDILPSEENSSMVKFYRKKNPFPYIPLLRGIIFRLLQWMNQNGWVDTDAEGRKRKVRKDNTYDLVVFLDYYMDKDADFDYLHYTKKIRGIYTDGFPPKGIKVPSGIEITEFCNQYLNDADALVAGAPSIKQFYQKYASIPVFFSNMAYNESVFKPIIRKKNNGFIVGWTGNPNRIFKGFCSHVLPAIKKLQLLGYSIELKTQFDGSLESLAAFWQGVDLAVIASEADAGPSMFMEASLCGVPSVSTCVGMPAYVIQDEVNGLFCERSVDDLASKIKFMLDNPDNLERMKKRIRDDYIEKLGVRVQEENWRNLLNEVLKDV